MKNLLLTLLLVVASIAPSFAQSAPGDYNTAQAQAIKDPSIVQMDQQITQLQAQLGQLKAKQDEANVKRNIIQDITCGYSGKYGRAAWDKRPDVITALYTDDATAIDPAAFETVNKQIADAKAARTQALWTKIEQINPALQPIVEQLRKIAASANKAQ